MLFCTLFLIINLFGQEDSDDPAIIILGTSQDAGFPQINCQKICCIKARKDTSQKIYVSCIGLIYKDKYFLFDATPNIKEQIEMVHQSFPHLRGKLPEGIFLTHAHIGHYTGLMELGREATNAQNIKVYAMPRMSEFLHGNGPWNQLIKIKNIEIIDIHRQDPISIDGQIFITPFLVPHRDEYSETVGYEIRTQDHRAVFIPDIDKWNKWKASITDIIKEVDYAFLDATFYDISELPNRNMEEIPHPFVVESMELFRNLDKADKKKVHFIHLNHSNPLLDENSEEYSKVRANGYSIAKQSIVLKL